MSRLSRLGNALSQMLNVLLLNGDPNESISGRCYREPWPRAMKVINTIFFWQSNHCRGAYHADLKWADDYIEQARQGDT